MFLYRNKFIEGINIPPLTISNQDVRIKNKGNQGTNGVFGDLIVKVYVHPHEKFTLQEYKEGKIIISSNETISLSQAVLGDTITIETYYGKQQLIIPSGTNHGDELIVEPPGFTRFKQIDAKMSVEEYFRSSKIIGNFDIQSKNSNKNQPISVIKISIDMPRSLNDIQQKILSDYMQTENSIS